MHLKELGLKNYRNYIKLELSFNSNLIVFSGKNAQGKTNILESIYLLSTGRSHRTPRDRELIKWEEDSSRVFAMVEKREGPSLIEIDLGLKENKRIAVNSMTVERIGELMGHINSILFSPEDLKLVKGSPTERRRFMDIEISQVNRRYFYSLQQYNRVLNHRNTLLKEINENSVLKATLPVWDEQLAKVGVYIMIKRAEFVKALNEIAGEVHRDISGDREQLSIVYAPSIDLEKEDPEALLGEYLEALEINWEEDIKRGRTEKGCHRDDLCININDMDLRTFGSQGQQRSTVLSLKLAEIEMMYRKTGEYPLLLLDDVMSELDSSRQAQILSYFHNVQTFLTITDYLDLPKGLKTDMEVYRIDSGTATKA